METIKPYLYFWDSWIVVPGLAVASVIWYLRARRYSKLAVCTGLIGVVSENALWALFPPQPGEWRWFWGLSMLFWAALLTAIVGFAWYWMKERPFASK